MFFFEQMFDTALNGINASGLMDTIHTTASAILLATALFAMFEAFARGGDTRALAVAGMKYLAVGLALAFYWETFRAVNAGFHDVAHGIASTDVWDNFRAQAQTFWDTTTSTFWNLVSGSVPGAISIIFQFLSVLLFPICCALFSFFYSLYGTVLYVVGPLVLALYPAMGVGQLARTYLVNLMVFFGWGIVYAVFCRVMIAINADSMTSIFTATSFGSWFQGSAQAVLLAAASILYSLMILLIPFIARRVVSGDVGSTMMTVAGTALTTARMVASASLGLAGGMTAAGGRGVGGSGTSSAASGGGGGPAGRGAGARGMPAMGGAAASAGSAPPRPGTAESNLVPTSAREQGNLQGWAGLPAASTEQAMASAKQAPADLQDQPLWRLGSPSDVRAMAESGDWSSAYESVAAASTPNRKAGSPLPAYSRGGSFVGSYAGDSRVGRNWSHAAGWAAGAALSSGYRRLRSSFTSQQQEE